MPKKNQASFSFIRVIIVTCFIVIGIVGIIISVVQTQKKTETSKAKATLDDGIYEQLKNITWLYKPIIRPEEIPVPDSMNGAIEPKVVSVYSPSVLKVSEGNYYMLFGVSLSCKAGDVSTIARDSIALAWSSDSEQWVFLKYVLEPDPTTCFSAVDQWKEGSMFQVNDPHLFFDGTTIRAVYTAVEWLQIGNTDGCGNIGIAAFDTNFNLLFRNDRFLQGKTACDGFVQGYSRPALKWRDGKTELWFDSAGRIKKTPLTAYDQIPVSQQIDSAPFDLIGFDVDLPDLDYDSTLLLMNGGLDELTYGNTATSLVGSWTDKWGLTQRSGQNWDDWYHGSPELKLNRDDCTLELYFAGMKQSENNIPIGTIAKAVPAPRRVFRFPRCKNYSLTITQAVGAATEAAVLETEQLSTEESTRSAEEENLVSNLDFITNPPTWFTLIPQGLQNFITQIYVNVFVFGLQTNLLHLLEGIPTPTPSMSE